LPSERFEYGRSVADIISISTNRLCLHRTAAEGLEYASAASSWRRQEQEHCTYVDSNGCKIPGIDLSLIPKVLMFECYVERHTSISTNARELKKPWLIVSSLIPSLARGVRSVRSTRQDRLVRPAPFAVYRVIASAPSVPWAGILPPKHFRTFFVIL
jgi:hypothetical protein